MTQTFEVESPTLQDGMSSRLIQPPHSRELYFALLDRPDEAADAGRDYLRAQIEVARAEPAELPDSLAQLPGWIQGRAETVGLAYREYLAGRKQGAPRRYFS